MNKVKVMRSLLYLVLVLVLTNLGGCKKLTSYNYPPETGTAYDIIAADNNYSTFRYIVNKADLVELFRGKEAYSVFIPVNSAFSNAGYTLNRLQNMPVEEVGTLVKNHVVAGALDVNTMVAGTELVMLSGMKVTGQKIGNLNYVNGGDIVNPALPVVRGFANVINTLLVSRATLHEVINSYAHGTSNSQLTFLAAAITRASTGSTKFSSLLTGDSPHTLFAPTNGAFIDAGYASIAAINNTAPDVLGNILKYHLISGAKFTTAFDSVPVSTINGTPVYFDKLARVVTPGSTLATNVSIWYANGINFGNNVPANLHASNGVIHIVPRLLPAPLTVTTLGRIQADTTLSLFHAIVQRAGTSDAGISFSKLLADLTGSYTVFAVNNAGIRAGGYPSLAAINEETPEALAEILKFHMVPGRINNISIAENGTIKTLLPESSLTILTAGGFKVKGASNVNTIPVISGNLVTTNGLLNIIGSVLTP